MQSAVAERCEVEPIVGQASDKPGSPALNRLATILLSPVDAASSVAFRTGFGLIMAIWAAGDLISGRVHALYEVPGFHFTYYLFDFVRPWPGAGMTLHFLILVGLALCIAAGLFYRIATVLFALGFSYFFLIDRTYYQNHYYLLLLLSWMLALLPLNRCAALDALRPGATRSDTIPAWCLWLVRFHVALPYLFGGIAKLNADWFAGEPLRSHLWSKAALPFVGPLLASETTIQLFVWGGLVFDLAIVPLLLWRRTRVPAYVLCIAFHLSNAFLFDIHVFPWFMILTTTIFFEPGWPRRLLKRPRPIVAPVEERSWRGLSWQTRIGATCLAMYCLAQLVIPFRHFLEPGDPNWTERGHHFSWRMMLRVKDSALWFYLTDPKTGKTGTADLRRFITLDQFGKASRDPEMILQLAHLLADEFRRKTGRDAEVRALVLTTLNGRKPQLLIDPAVDLAREPRGFHQRPWIMAQTEPLRDKPWTIPVAEWQRHVELPPLPFLQKPAVSPPHQQQEQQQQTTASSRN